MSGTLQASVVKDGASATNNLAMDASGNVTVGNNLTVTGTSSHTGNATFSGTLAVTGTITGSSTVAASAGTLYPIVSGTAQASTSGTSIDFTGIPSWVKRITVMFNGVSTSGTSNNLVQLGAGSITATGYLAGSKETSGTGSAYTTGFGIQTASAAAIIYGHMIFTLAGSNLWIASHVIYLSQTSSYLIGGGGSVTLGGTLDRVRITTVNGTDTFDAGSINILYE